MSVAIAPVYAGGDKVQHENGADTAPDQGMMLKVIK